MSHLSDRFTDRIVQFDDESIYCRFDHRNPLYAALGSAIRTCAIVASGQPVATGKPEEYRLLGLQGDQLALFYSELRRFVMYATKRRPRRRARFLEIISTCEACEPSTFIVCTATSSAGTWTTVHAHLLPLPNIGKVERKALVSHEVVANKHAGLLAFPNWASKSQSAA